HPMTPTRWMLLVLGEFVMESFWYGRIRHL
ncbi:MAG: hypothetical protein RL691_232, partial [Actinomycetota bacterium]